MNRFVRGALLGAVLQGLTFAAQAAPDWSKVPARTVIAFYPGVASLEWAMEIAEHSGGKGMRKGESCISCHEGEGREIGRKIVSGEKLEPAPPKDKAPALPVLVQAAHDGTDLYLRFQWKPGSADPAAKEDSRNRAKLAVMIEDGKVEYASIGGCWATCHDDLRSMPGAATESKKHPRAKELDFRDNGPTKYIAESRSAMEMKVKPRGGWDKIKPEEELAEALKAGKFFEILQFRSGAAPRSGYLTAARYMKETPGVAEGSFADGQWTVVFKRPLAASGPGSHNLKSGGQYNFGFAIHDEYSNERHHHVSFGYVLGIDSVGGEIKAMKQ